MSESDTSYAPLVLVTGPEELLADRAVATVIEQRRRDSDELDVIKLSAADYVAGDLAQHSAPSLFGGDTVIVVADVDEAGDELITDLLAALDAPPEPGITLVVRHKSGARGKKVLETMKSSGASVLTAPALKSDRDKTDFVVNEFRTARRKITPDAVRALVEAVGQSPAELASAAAQLVSDTEGTIDVDTVMTYHGGKVEATGFKVADAALAGEDAEALRLLRHALAVGIDPVPIVAVLAGQIRQLIRVGAAGRGRSADVARELGMAPWQVDKARRSLGGWTAEALGHCVAAVAQADVDVKGGGRDPVYAVERAIIAMGRYRRAGNG